MRAIITVVGIDRIGIIAGVSNLLADARVNILDISQTILKEYFTMIMLVDLREMKISHKDLVDRLNKKGEELGLSIKMQHEDLFNAMHRI